MKHESSEFRELKRQIKTADTPLLQGQVRRHIENLIKSHRYPLSVVAQELEIPLVKKGRTNIARILNLEDELRKKFPPLDETRLSTSFDIVSDVFVPPDLGQLRQGDGNGHFVKPAILPRIDLALDVMKKMGIDYNSCQFMEGVNTPEMMRGLSYRMIVIPNFDKTVLICDEEGNRTFVIFDAQNYQNYFNLQKSQLQNFVENGQAMDFIWTNPVTWKEKLEEVLRMNAPLNSPRGGAGSKKPSTPNSVPTAPSGWQVLSNAAKTAGIAISRFKKMIVAHITTHPDWLKSFTDKRNRVSDHYDPELIELVKKEVEDQKAPEGWMTESALAIELKLHSNTLKGLIEPFRKTHPDEFHEYADGIGKLREQYSPMLVSQIRKLSTEKFKPVPIGWITIRSFISSLDVTERVARELIESHKVTHPEWFGEYKLEGRGGWADFVAPELVQTVKKTCESNESCPEGWLKMTELASDYRVALSTIASIIDPLREKYIGHIGHFQDKTMKLHEYISPELKAAVVAVLDEREGPPRGWSNLRNITAITGRSYQIHRELIEPYRESNPEWFRTATYKGSLIEYYAPELVEIVLKSIAPRPPNDWVPASAIAQRTGVSRKLIASIIDETIGEHSEAVGEFQKVARKTSYYSPEYAEFIAKRVEERKKLERPNENWLTCGALADELKIAYTTVQRMAEGHRDAHPEWFVNYYTTNNIFGEHFAPELTQIIRDNINSREKAPEGWLYTRLLARQAGITRECCNAIVEEYRSSHPEWFRLYFNEYSQELEYYSPELVAKVLQDVKKYGNKPEGYRNTSQVAKFLGIDHGTVGRAVEAYREKKPEWFSQYRTGQTILECFSPELVDKMRDDIEGIELVPEGWCTNGGLAKELGVDLGTTKKIANEYRGSNPDWFRLFKYESGQRHEFFSPELVTIIRDEINQRKEAPDGWLTPTAISRELNVDFGTITNISDPHHESNPEWFTKFKSGTQFTEHYAPELIEIIRKTLLARDAVALAPEGAITLRSLAIEHSMSYTVLLNMARLHENRDHGSLTKNRSKKNRVGLYVSAELATILTEEIGKMSDFPEVPDGWLRMSELTQKADIDPGTLKEIVNSVEADHEDQVMICEYTTRRTALHYGPEFVKAVCKLATDVKNQRQLPEGWETLKSLSSRLSIGNVYKNTAILAFRESNPEWFKTVRISPEISYEYISPELIVAMEEEYRKIDAIPITPQGWLTNAGVAKALGTHEATVKKIAAQYRESNPEWFRQYCYQKRKPSEHYSPELIAIITERHEARMSIPEAPEGWICNHPLAKALGVSQPTPEKIANEYRESNPEWFQEFRDAGGRPSVHYSPELVKIIKKEIKVN